MIEAGWSRPAETIYIDDREVVLATRGELRELERILDVARAAPAVQVVRMHGHRSDYAVRCGPQVPRVTTLS